ncbi:MAG: phosphate propanoyltransferase [Eubacterium sp.]|nr:phosphate propanoyltransferase [Eubacterium sp.]
MEENMSTSGNETLVKLITKLVMEELYGMSTQIPIGVSNKHIHLSRKDMDVLFGEGSELTPIKDLGQPGQYACAETVAVKGPKGEFARVRVLGPLRSESQVELSKTDARTIGVKAPIRESGVLEGTPGVELVGPEGSVQLERGVIVALRHIHMTPELAKEWGLKDKDIVDVKVNGGDRAGILGNVIVRVSDKYALEMHVDTDEANACCLDNNDTVSIIRK